MIFFPPTINYNLSLFVIKICAHTRVFACLCGCVISGTAGTWSVHLAGVQRAAHRIMMTVAAASAFLGHENEPREREEMGKK